MTQELVYVEELRTNYDQAFEELVMRVRELQVTEIKQPNNIEAIRDLRQRVKQAEAAYREARNLLADQLLRH
ncbi:MAG TPA: hypothetical protein VKU01_16770 [Bryobacteraceae bacterium]|nr:hypothetical protein [Bryobacteraceae bacterium]